MPAIQTIATCVTAGATVALCVVAYRQLRYASQQLAKIESVSRSELQITNQLALNAKFESKEMRSDRKKLAKLLLSKKKTKHEDVPEQVPNFFETVGTQMRVGYLNPELVWADFQYWVVRWWNALHPYIMDERSRLRNNETIFEDFEAMVEIMYRVDSARRKGNPRIFDLQAEVQEELRSFLLEETKLDTRK